MEQIPDAPWIRDPEPYITEYYGKRLFLSDAEEEEDGEDHDDDEEAEDGEDED